MRYARQYDHFSVTDGPTIGAEEMLVIDPSASDAKFAISSYVVGLEYRFPEPGRTASVRSLRPFFWNEMSPRPVVYGKLVASYRDWKKVVMTLRTPDSDVIVNQYPAYMFLNGQGNSIRNRKPTRFFRNGTLVDFRQSFIQFTDAPSGDLVFPFSVTYW